MNNDPMTASNAPSIAFYILLASIILVPISFWANHYFPMEMVKTFLIDVTTLTSAILLGFLAIKERSVTLPPKSLVVTSILISLCLIISSLVSIHPGKSFFGYGFEIGTASFILLLFVSALVAFSVTVRRPDRALVLYVGMAATFFILYIFQALRLIYGPGFLSMGLLSTYTSSLIGGWYNLGTFSMIMVLIALLALQVLRPSRKMQILYCVLLTVSALAAIIVTDFRVWFVASIVFLGLTIYFSILKCSSLKAANIGAAGVGRFSLLMKCLAWIPLVAFLFAALFIWQGQTVAGKLANNVNANYGEISLSWQATLNIAASALQNYPLFGVGPNNFGRAFLAYKPIAINTTEAWGTEFPNGFGLIPTFVVTQGLFGAIAWILFFIFFAIIGTKALKNTPSDPGMRFVVVSSYAVSVFLWIIMMVSVPSLTIIFLAFIMTGIFAGTAMASGSLPKNSIAPLPGTRLYKLFPSFMAIFILAGLVWGLSYIKKTVALAYFAGGQTSLNKSVDPVKADASFAKALRLDSSDIYWQGRAESALAQVQKLASTVTADTSASTTQAISTQAGNILKNGFTYADNAVKYDPTNYYNLLSVSRVAEMAAGLKMDKAYEATVAAYAKAINLNPYNPSLYLSLAGFQARQNKLDDSLKTLGAALQVKNNYLDAVFLLSQIYAAKGDLANAIVAAKVATQLNPENALLFFQLGILDYNSKDYAGAVVALAQAVKIQPDYANAKYFLGLSQARLQKTSEAIEQFDSLSQTNPDNQEVALILANLHAGKPIFADAQPPVTTAPEKRSNLPIKEKR